jgi:leader peptidase (prepilin peptidase)/N-methyltransferase
MLLVCIFAIGTIIGSFLNVCIYRIPKEESIKFPGSHCAYCKKHIKAYDLIPIFSYIFLKGRCRYCKSKISIRYPSIEFITGILFTVTFLRYGMGINFFKYAFLVSLIIAIGVIDFDTTEVYFKTILFGMFSGAIFILIQFSCFDYSVHKSINYLYAGISGFCMIALIIFITGGMGWGDAEICFLCGLFLGLKENLIMIFISFVIGGAVGIILLASNIKSRKEHIPFGPFIAISTIITTLFSSEIINWYLNILQ